MSPRAGMLRVAALPALLALSALLAPSAAQAAGDAPPRVYRVSQALRLDEGQTGTYTLACRRHDVATDGTWLVDAVEANPDLDDAAYDLVTGVDVLEAASFAAGAYRFTLRNNAEGGAQVRIAVTCLQAGPDRHRLALGPRRTERAELAPGPGSPLAIACPRGTIAVAPGFRAEGLGAAPRLTTRAPAGAGARRFTWAFTAIDAATVRTSARCLATRVGRHRLHATYRAGTTDVSDGRVETFTVSCRASEQAIVGTFRLSGSWYLGQAPAGRQRSFKLQSPPDGRSADAALGLLCLRLAAARPR
ncbi:MAG TPA: hypothetical protein VFR97_00390 [Capillimicrobium sp.]|nr:hypothetical protein [Capillimicrobium sp.]